MARILIVDDEKDLVWAMRYGLKDEGYEVIAAYDGLEAIAAARLCRPDLVILDIIMPRLDGLKVCRRLRRDPSLASVPILFLTLLGEIEDRVAGLNEGGDDYLVKPFDLRELKARVKALLRRGQSPLNGEPRAEGKRQLLVVGPVDLNTRTCKVCIGEKTRQLTPVEFNLLHHMMLYPGEVFSTKQLLEQVWGYPPGTADPSLVRWHIKNLRAKIEPDPAHPVYIRTVHLQGYMFERRRSPL